MPISKAGQDFRKRINRNLDNEAFLNYKDGKERELYHEEYIGKTGMSKQSKEKIESFSDFIK